VEVKKLIVAELNHPSWGPRELSHLDIRVEDLTLKTLGGDAIEGEMREGDEFLAELNIQYISDWQSEKKIAKGIASPAQFENIILSSLKNRGVFPFRFVKNCNKLYEVPFVGIFCETMFRIKILLQV
jgi:hypothetical protein